MPHIGWVVKGKKTSLADALVIAEETGHFERFPPAALRKMHVTDRAPLNFSPSTAMACIRQRMLREVEPYYLDPDNQWSMTRGSAVHLYLDEGIKGMSETSLGTTLRFANQETGEIHEVHMSGTMDYYDRKRKRIIDYKTTRTFFVPSSGGGRVSKSYPTPEHELQVNLYAFLCRENNMEVDTAFIWYLSQADGRKMVPVELWSAEEARETAHNLASFLIEPRTTGALPPAFQPGDAQFWQCNYCPVAERCREIEKVEYETKEAHRTRKPERMRRAQG
jgi:hypothetical protein